MSWLSDSASYGPPAEYVPRNIELEGSAAAFKDILPKKAHLFADTLSGVSGEYLSVDQPFYNQYKEEINAKAQSFKERLDSGEQLNQLIPEMTQFRNQSQQAMNLFNQRKDAYGKWDEELTKNTGTGPDKIDKETADKARQVALFNIQNYTKKQGLGVDLPLPTVSKKINYHQAASKFVDEQVAREGAEQFGSEWSAIAADPTKYANFKSGWERSNPEKIELIVRENLMKDPDVQASMNQEADFSLFDEYNTAPDEIKGEIKQYIPQAHSKYKQDIIDNVASELAYTKEGLKKTIDRTIIDNTEAGERAKIKANEEQTVPVYDAPQTPVKGLDRTNSFKLQEAGTYIPYTQEEAKKIYGNLSPTGGRAWELAAAKIAAGKKSTEKTYIQPNEMSKQEQNFLSGIAHFVNPTLEKKIKAGEVLTKEEQDSLYPQADKMLDRAKQDVEVNSRVIGLTTKEFNEINRDIFGNKELTVKNLGTGSAGNLKFYFKETGEVLDISQLKDKFSAEDKVLINGKFTGENPYPVVTGDVSFANPKQLFINGKEVIVSGPKAFVTTDSQSTANPEQAKLLRTKAINNIYSAKFSTLPVESKIYGQKVVSFFDENSGIYKVILNKEKAEEFGTASEAENYIFEHVTK